MKEMKEILKVIEEAPQRFELQIPEIEKKIFQEISLLLKDLKTNKNGGIQSSIENLRIINEVKSKLGKIIVSKKYVSLVREFVSNIPSINNFQLGMKGIPVDGKKMLTAVAKAQIDSTLESLMGSGYRQDVVSKLYNTLLINVTSGGSYSDMIEQLQSQLITTEEKPGMLSKYTQTFVVDSLGEFAGQGNKIVADALKSEWFQYVGSNLTTTREFCEHLTKKRYVHVSEIPELLKGKIDGHQCKIYEKTGLPYGMKEDTNPDNFIVHRGGWRCGHELVPVDKVMVPKEVRDRINQELNQKPVKTEEQKERAR
jgi:hypothetical protein